MDGEGDSVEAGEQVDVEISAVEIDEEVDAGDGESVGEVNGDASETQVWSSGK